MDRPLQIHIKPSRIAQYYCAVVIVLSWLGIGLADLPWFVQALLVVLVLVHGWRVAISLQDPLIRALEYRNGDWYLLHGESGFCQTELEKKFFLGAGIIVLPFRLQCGECRRLLLWPDSADKDSLRRLRACLLM